MARLAALVLTLLALGALPASAATLEAESGRGGQRVSDRSASGGKAVRLVRRARLALTFNSPGLDGVTLRVRARGCLRATAGGRRATLRVRSGRWRQLVARLPLPAGRVTLRLVACRGRILVDTVGWPGIDTPEGRPSQPPPPALPPQGEPPPPSGQDPPPESLLPSTVGAVLVEDAPPRWGPVQLGAAVFTPYMSDPGYQDAFLANFDGLTTENEMKWERIEPQPGLFAFHEADALVAFASRHGKPVRGHTLIWGGMTPAWVSAAESPEAMREIMRRHISGVVSRYRGKVAEWDVVNEPIDEAGRFRDHAFHRALGPDYVEFALRAARAADPDARLCINEWGAEVRNATSDALLALVERLKLAGVPLDCVGFENHTYRWGWPNRDAMIENLRRFTALGVQVQITEMDVVANGDGDAATRMTQQATAYRDAAEACQAVAACTRLSVWGVSDKFSWLGAGAEALLLDAQYRPKPGLTAVRRAFGR